MTLNDLRTAASRSEAVYIPREKCGNMKIIFGVE